MTSFIIIALLLIVIASIVYIEYKNEKNYQKERKERRESRYKKKQTSTKTSPPADKPKTKTVEKRQTSQKPSRLKEHTEKRPEKEHSNEKVTINVELPKAIYPRFDHSRLLEMGLSDDEARSYVRELIPQIEAQIPLIEEALKKRDFHTMERLTHSIKGSSTTVGKGGVSDLLVAFNDYLKEGKEPSIAEAYLKHLKHYHRILKEQYIQEEA